MNELFLIVFLGFFVLLLLTRLIGKKQLGQLNVFTYITGIAIGNMAGEIILHPEIKVLDGMIGMTIWTALMFIIEYIGLKSGKIRSVLDGEPTIVIKKGIIQYKELKKLRLNIDDLTMLLRTNKIFSIKDVNYAILEPNGDLSVVRVKEKEQVTKKDMDIKVKEDKYIPTEIIVDGKIVYKNLKELGKTEKWVIDNLGKNNLKNVIYAELQEDGELYIQTKN